MGSKVEDLAKYFFMLKLDFSKDGGLSATYDDSCPKAIDTRLNTLVFRSRLTCPEKKSRSGFPPFEYFEMSYPV